MIIYLASWDMSLIDMKFSYCFNSLSWTWDSSSVFVYARCLLNFPIHYKLLDWVSGSSKKLISFSCVGLLIEMSWMMKYVWFGLRPNDCNLELFLVLKKIKFPWFYVSDLISDSTLDICSLYDVALSQSIYFSLIFYAG